MVDGADTEVALELLEGLLDPVNVKGTSKNAIFAHRRFRIGLTIC